MKRNTNEIKQRFEFGRLFYFWSVLISGIPYDQIESQDENISRVKLNEGDLDAKVRLNCIFKGVLHRTMDLSLLR